MDMILASGPLFILVFILLALIGVFSFIVKQATKNQYKNVKVNRVDEKEEAKKKQGKPSHQADGEESQKEETDNR